MMCLWFFEPPRYKDEKTCGIVQHDEAGGMTKIAEPVGVVAGVWRV